MSEYFFGLTKEKISKREGNRRDKIAKKFGGNFTGPIDIPGNNVRGWFSIPNRGNPFDQKTSQEILSACGLL